MSAAVEHLLKYLHGGWPSTKKHTALRSEIEKVRIEALLEAAEIALKEGKNSPDDIYDVACRAVRDAILERAETLTPHFHSTSGGRDE